MDLMARITKAVRNADGKFEEVGGSSRHWVRECLLPELEAEGLAVVDTSDPWLPIEECGELEAGEYLVRMKEFITIARWSGAEWQVRIVDAERYYYRAEHITHVHRMGPIRRPGEG